MSGPEDPAATIAPCNCTSTSTSWFPVEPSGQNDWRLDVVTLLAVIGESSMAEHSQAITASWLCLFPRILPAPQALLKPQRPSRMPETHAKMAGVHSGVVLDSVGFFANILHPLDEYEAYTFQMLDIRHKDPSQASGHVPPSPTRVDSFFGRMMRRASSMSGSPKAARDASEGKGKKIPRAPGNQDDLESGNSSNPAADEKATSATGRSVTFAPASSANGADEGEPTPGTLRKRLTFSERATDILANPTLATNAPRPAVPAQLRSPIHILTVFSFLLTVAIVVLAIFWQDGTAICSIMCVSFATSVVGYASWWKPILMNRTHTNTVPAGDVMIRTREGAFLLIRCTEEVARELYSGTEECKYRVGPRRHRLLMGLGTVFLMIGVVLLGNCNWSSQIIIGASYVFLNGAYWGLGMLPKKYFWDLSRYTCHDITPPDIVRANRERDEKDQREGTRSFTRALWFAIRETQAIGWVERSGAAPGTAQWKEWLAEAELNAKDEQKAKTWKAVARKDEIMKKGFENGRTDAAAERAPATEVQPPAAASTSNNSF